MFVQLPTRVAENATVYPSAYHVSSIQCVVSIDYIATSTGFMHKGVVWYKMIKNRLRNIEIHSYFHKELKGGNFKEETRFVYFKESIIYVKYEIHDR